MHKQLKLEFDWCDIELHSEITMGAGISFKFTDKSDGEGNILPPADRPTFYHELDNYQAYELAMSILNAIDVKGK
ncbi:MAG: hypothetical protein HRT61_00620 [Ekhidna sp.]|nr:hypothetical protein [Ekhidna sp.]